MTAAQPSDDVIRDVLTATRTIALVGASDKPARPSHRVMRTLLAQGYQVVPVNPRLAGRAVHGRTAYARLGDIPGTIDMVDIFRRSDAVAPIVDQAIQKGAKVIWMQLGVIDEAAAARARAAGLTVIMNHCPAIEGPRLGLWSR